MSEILSQAEIEALLSSLTGEDSGSAAAAPEAPAPKPVSGPPIFAPATIPGSKGAVAYEVYDFRRPDKFSKEQLRTLQMLHETFARQAGTGLSAFLRSPVNIELISLEQVPYDEYLRSISQSVFTIMSIPPLTGQAVLEIEFNLVFTMIDKLLGGPGRSLNRTMLTDIERPLLRQIVERTFSAFKSAWEGVVVVNPGIEGMETSAQFVQIAPPSDIVVTILFEVKVGSSRGAMSLCIPYLVLKPITAKLSAQKWFVSASRKHNPLHRKILAHQVQRSTVTATILLGKTRITIRDFIHLKAGDMLRLDSPSDEPIDLLIAGTPKFQGRPALDGRKLVFHVTNEISEAA